MFTDFFYLLRQRKVPVSITEWMTLMEALSRGCIRNLDEFYFLARAILVKSESHFDAYDVAFQEYFKGVAAPAEINEQVLEWLEGDRTKLERFQGEYKDVDLDELIRELEKRLKEQTGPHDGGGYWVGRFGTSPFGHSGHAPYGIRIGGEGGGGRALKIAQERRFRNYRDDVTLDVRQIKVALKGLRQLTRTGPEEELDLDRTIQKTARNYGELELVWRRARRNNIKLLLMMDAGGSMEPYAQLCSQLFSAAHSAGHFKDFRYAYFHNCVYSNLYRDMERYEAISTEEYLRNLGPEYKLVMVGDARMAPYEITDRQGAIGYYDRTDIPGLVWLKRLSEHFTHSAWLNPEEEQYWMHPSVRMIGQVFPMFPLTIEGLGRAVKKLTVKR